MNKNEISYHFMCNPSRTRAIRVILAVIGFLGAVLLIEIGLRGLREWLPDGLRAISPPLIRRWYADALVRDQPDLPQHLRPGLAMTVREKEFLFQVVTTRFPGESFGIREEAVIIPSWGLALGNSFTFGSGVDADEAWPDQLEKLMGRAVLNAGVPGACTNDALEFLKRIGDTVAPQVVLWGIFQNDVSDNYLKFHPPPPPEGTFRRIGQDIRSLLWRYSVFYGLLKYGFAELTSRKTPLDIDSYPGKVYVDFSRKDLREGLEIAHADIEKVNGWCDARTCRLVVILFPMQEQVSAASGSDSRPFSLNRELAAFCGAKGIAVIDLVPSLEAAARSDSAPLYFLHDGHFTARGHRIAAERIRDFLVTGS